MVIPRLGAGGVNPTIPQGYHIHKCRCGQAWMHSDDMAGNQPAHECVRCGAIVWEKWEWSPVVRRAAQACAMGLYAFLRRMGL